MLKFQDLWTRWMPMLNSDAGGGREGENETKPLLTQNVGRGLLALVLLGALLIMLGKTQEPEQPVAGTLQPAQQPQATPVAGRDDNVSHQLRTILAQVEGVGAVEVFITMDSGPELTVAEEVTTQRTDKKGEVPGATSADTRETRRPVTVRDDAARIERPLVLVQKEGRVRGVVVVADGANSARVRYELARAVEVALGVPAHRVAVFERR